MSCGQITERQIGFQLKVLKKLSQSFLDRTPLGVSLQTPSIAIGGSDIGATEGEIALESCDSSNGDGRPLDSDTVYASGNISYDEPIRVLTTWLEERGWTVQWYTTGDHIDAVTLPNKLVTISQRQIPRHRYYTLLHEVSHVDLLTGPPETRHGEPHGYLDLWYATIDERTLRHRVAVVIDEIIAWDHGIKLATNLGIGVDPIKYRDFRNRNLKSYFDWAINRDEVE